MTKDIIFNLAKDHLNLEFVDLDTVVFGIDSSLDSLGLVSFLADIEQSIYETYQVEIVIASERAMSLKYSPFQTVGSLVDFVNLLVEEEKQ